MILYFSATGNNKFIANYINDFLSDEVVSLNDVLKENKPLIFSSIRPFVVIAPIHAWRYPRNIEDLIKKAKFIGSNKIFFIASMGLNCGNANIYLKKITISKNMQYMGFAKIIMPSNYVIAEKAINKQEAIDIIKDSLNRLDELANIIKNEQKFIEPKKELYGNLLSGFINYGFNNFFASSKHFKVSDNCIKCQKCIKLCPTNNISLKNNKITFSNNCMFCLACINNCPTKAITYKNKHNGTYTCSSIEQIKKSK